MFGDVCFVNSHVVFGFGKVKKKRKKIENLEFLGDEIGVIWGKKRAYDTGNPLWTLKTHRKTP